MKYVQDNVILFASVDHVTDCHDMFDFVCGAIGVPADNSQRIGILSLREDRLSGRIRGFFHAPSEMILADALTKPGFFKGMMFYLTTGCWKTSPVFDN